MMYVSIPPKGPWEHQFTLSESEAAQLHTDLRRVGEWPITLPSLTTFLQMLAARYRP